MISNSINTNLLLELLIQLVITSAAFEFVQLNFLLPSLFPLVWIDCCNFCNCIHLDHIPKCFFCKGTNYLYIHYCSHNTSFWDIFSLHLNIHKNDYRLEYLISKLYGKTFAWASLNTIRMITSVFWKCF